MKKSKINVYILLIAFASILMSIGYAAINGVSLEMNGMASIPKYEGILITNATLQPSSNSNITMYYETILKSYIVLESNASSTESVQITILNNTNEDMYFDNIIYDNDFYDNENIDYTITGLEHKQKLEGNNSQTFTLTFKYADSYIATNPQNFENTLTSYLKFRFKKGYPISYVNITGTGYPAVALEEENLVVDFGSNAPSDIGIVGLETSTTYTKGTDYTYTNGILTFNGVSEELEITGSSSGGQGTPDNPYVDSGPTTYHPSIVPANSTILYTSIPGEPLVTSDPSGKITSFEYTNIGQNGIPVQSGGLDTGILAFDGDFTVTLKATLNYNNCDNGGKVCPIINVSKKDPDVNGVLIYETGHFTSGHGHNASGANVDPYNKFRFGQYENSESKTNIDFNINSKVTSAQMNGRYGYNTSSSPLTVTFKLYCVNNVFSAEMYDAAGNILAKPYNNTTYSYSNPDSSLENVTISIGTYDGFNEGQVYYHNFDILEFKVEKQ